MENIPRYGVMEGYPVIFNRVKAIWNTGKGWQDISTSEVIMNAKVLSRDEFNARFDIHDIPMAFFHD